MTTDKTALVLGASGGIGGEVARGLLRRGWRVRGLSRRASTMASAEAHLPTVQWLRGDAMNPADVLGAARDASLLVHAVNPPGYRDWDKLVLPMLDNSIGAAKATGALILLPGNVYNYGPDAFPLIAEGAPQRPASRKGMLRVEMEARLRRAAEAGARGLVVRAGDYFGPRGRQNWFSQGLVTPGKPVRRVAYPGRRGIGHAWAFLPDVAETMIRLVEREEALEPFDTFHMDGHWDPDGTAMVAATGRAIGRPDLEPAWFPWPVLMAASPFVTMLREMREMRYLWRTPVRLDNARLRAVLGAEPNTPLDDAVRATLTGLGCLDGAKAFHVSAISA